MGLGPGFEEGATGRYNEITDQEKRLWRNGAEHSRHSEASDSQTRSGWNSCGHLPRDEIHSRKCRLEGRAGNVRCVESAWSLIGRRSKDVLHCRLTSRRRIGFAPMRFADFNKRVAEGTWDTRNTRDEPETLSRRKDDVDEKTSSTSDSFAFNDTLALEWHQSKSNYYAARWRTQRWRDGRCAKGRRYRRERTYSPFGSIRLDLGRRRAPWVVCSEDIRE